MYRSYCQSPDFTLDTQAKIWCVGVGPLSESRDQLVGVGEQQVVWYEGLDPDVQTVRKVYGLETPALQVFWGQFEHSDAIGVCIREREHLGVFLESGTVHYAAFPFVVSIVHWYMLSVTGHVTAGAKGMATGLRGVGREADRS